MSIDIMVASASGTAWELKKKGDELLKKGDYEGAGGLYQQSIDLDPGWVPTWNNLELVHVHLGRMQDAERCRAKKKELEEQLNADDLKRRGDELAKSGDFKVAIKYYQKAVELDPVNIPAWNNLGAAYSRLGRLDEAHYARQRKRELEILTGQKPEPLQTKIPANMKKEPEPWATEPSKEKSSWGSRFRERMAGLSSRKESREARDKSEISPPSKWDTASPVSKWDTIPQVRQEGPLKSPPPGSQAKKKKLEAMAAEKPPQHGEQVPEVPKPELEGPTLAELQPEKISWSEQFRERLGGVREKLQKVGKESPGPDPVHVVNKMSSSAPGPVFPSAIATESLQESGLLADKEEAPPMSSVAGDESHPESTPSTSVPEIQKRPEDYTSASELKQKGDELVRSGNFEGALLFYQKAVELDPYNAAAWNNLGASYHRLGRTEEADHCRAKKKELEILVAQNLVSPEAHAPGREVGQVRTTEAFPGEISLSEQFSEWVGGVDDASAPSGPAAVPKAPQQAAPKTPPPAAKPPVIKPVAQKIKVPSSWQKTARPAAEPPPKKAIVAETKTTQLGSLRIFGREVLKARKKPEDFDNDIELKQEGDRLAKAGEYEAALGYYQRAISIDPAYLKAWNNLGYTYYHLGMQEEAEKCRAKRKELAALRGQKQFPGDEHAPYALELGTIKDEEEPVEKSSYPGGISAGLKGLFSGRKKAEPEPAEPSADADVAKIPLPKKTAAHLQAPEMQKEQPAMTHASPVKPGGRAIPEHQSDYTSSATVEPKTRRFTTLKFFSKTGKKKGKMLEEYDPAIHGNLVEEYIPEEYEPVDEYWIDEGRAHVRVMRNINTNQNEYLLFEPALSEFEYELLERLYEDLRDVLILNEEELTIDRRIVLFGAVQDLLNEYGLHLDDSTIFKLQYFIQRNFLGWLRIDALMRDPNIEDISCDGIGIPIFLYHRKYRNIKTNITFEETDLNSLAITLAQRSGKHISIGSPMIGATLPDGSRLQLSLGTEVTTRGTSFTIRKFREVPFTPIELMNFNTFDLDSLVYFWVAIENNKSLLFVGGTASGKTTSLNAVSLFIPPLAKIVSIEDTREITLYHENWIASVTRESVSEGMGTTIMMFDLLKAAMRQRPEFIIVGEVRGVEAQTLFQAMNTGHTTFSTMHAGGVDAAIHRLESEPLNVPRNMIQALNIVSVQALIHREGERVRRCLEIVELAGIDPITGNIQVNNVFEYDPVTDIFTYSGRSLIYHDIIVFSGWTPEQFAKELEIRKKVLTAMKEQGLTDYVIVSSIIQTFATERDLVLDNIDNLRAVIR